MFNLLTNIYLGTNHGDDLSLTKARCCPCLTIRNLRSAKHIFCDSSFNIRVNLLIIKFKGKDII